MHRWFRGPVIMVLLLSLAGFSADDNASIIKSADALLLERKFERARILYERALDGGIRFDHDLSHARNLASAYLNSTPPDLANGIKWSRIALMLDPASDSLRAQLAELLVRSGDLDGAIEQYRVLVNGHPQSSEYVIALATALRHGGKTDDALGLLQTTTENYPNIVSVRVEYGRLLNFTKQFAEAKRQFSIVLEADPDNLIAQVGIAKSTSYEGDQETSLELYDRILRRHPGLYDAIIGKAFSLLWSGRTQQARVLLQAGLARHPDDQEVRKALATLPDATVDPQRPASAQNGRRVASARPARIAASTELTERDAPIRPESRNEPAPYERRQPHNPVFTIATACLGVAMAAYALSRSLRSQQAQSSKSSDSLGQGFFESLPTKDKFHDINRMSDKSHQLHDPGITSHGSDGAVLKNSEAAAPETVPKAMVSLQQQRREGTMRPKVLLVGGSAHLVELERRWFPIANPELIWESEWLQASARMLSAPPDLLVLNATSNDGWTSEEMFHWIVSIQPELQSRTIVIRGHRGANACSGEQTGGTRFVVEPFNAKQWRDAIESMLLRLPRT